MTSDLKKVREEAAKKEKELKTALEQINLLTKEKGVAMRDNATSYEQSIQKETQVSVASETSACGQLDWLILYYKSYMSVYLMWVDHLLLV